MRVYFRSNALIYLFNLFIFPVNSLILLHILLFTFFILLKLLYFLLIFSFNFSTFPITITTLILYILLIRTTNSTSPFNLIFTNSFIKLNQSQLYPFLICQVHSYKRMRKHSHLYIILLELMMVQLETLFYKFQTLSCYFDDIASLNSLSHIFILLSSPSLLFNFLIHTNSINNQLN